MTIDNVFWNVPFAWVGDITVGTAELSNADGKAITFLVFNESGVEVDRVESIVEDGTALFTFTPVSAGSFTFSARCEGETGTSPALTVLVRIPPPQAIFEVVPTSIRKGQSATLNWNTENAQAVFLSGFGNVTLDGSQVVRPNKTTIYTLTVTGLDGTILTKTVSLRVTLRSNSTLVADPK